MTVQMYSSSLIALYMYKTNVDFYIFYYDIWFPNKSD